MKKSKKIHKKYKNPKKISDILKRKGIIDNNSNVDDLIEVFGCNVVNYYFGKVYSVNLKHGKSITTSSFMKLYSLDMLLRSNIGLQCFQFENLFKSCLNHVLCQYSDNFLYKSHPHLNDEIYRKEFKDKEDYKYSINQINDKTKENLKKKYKSCNPSSPTIWDLLDRSTLGGVVTFYENLSSYLKKKISIKFGVENENIFLIWLRNICTLRNEISHNGRVSNFKFKNKNDIYHINTKEIPIPENVPSYIKDLDEKIGEINPKTIPESGPYTLKSGLEILSFLIKYRSVSVLGLEINNNKTIELIDEILSYDDKVKISGF